MKTQLRAVVPLLLWCSVALGAGKPAPPPPAPFTPAITYVQTRYEGSAGYRDLMVMSADGTQKKMLVAGTATVSNGSPSFSPDGTRIVFRSTVDGPGLYVIPASGGTPSKLTTVTRNHGWVQPAWSPDGRWILFVDYSGQKQTYNSGEDHDVYCIEVDPATGIAVSGVVHRLTNTPETKELHPGWSRDGSRVGAFVWVDGFTQELWTYSFVGTSGAPTLTFEANLSLSMGEFSFGSGRVSWSRNANSEDIITFSAGRPGESGPGGCQVWNLWVIRVLSRQYHRLTYQLDVFHTKPVWSPDDSRIAFTYQKVTGGAHYVALLQNAADLVSGATSTPVITETVARAEQKVTDFLDLDWRR